MDKRLYENSKSDASGDREKAGEKKDAADIIRECVDISIKRIAHGADKHKDCMDIYADFKAAVEYISEGTNTVLLDEVGMPSIMVKIDAINISGLIEGASNDVHPAFEINGARIDHIYVSKYQNIVCNDRAYSLPMQDPQAHITFDESDLYCRNKGNGWGLMPFSLRAAIALWTKKNKTIPNGNNFGGRDFFCRHEQGKPTQEGRVATGSGPSSWAHNGKPDGIYDMNGNLNEWDAGLRLVDGEIQIIPGADSLLKGSALSPKSSQWRAIMPDGTLADPGTKGSLRYFGDEKHIILTDEDNSDADATFNCAFHDIKAAKWLKIPEIVKALMLFPETDKPEYGTGWRWVRTKGEYYPLCGGASAAVDHAGIFFVGLTYPRTHRYLHSGFRAAYIPLDR